MKNMSLLVFSAALLAACGGQKPATVSAGDPAAPSTAVAGDTNRMSVPPETVFVAAVPPPAPRRPPRAAPPRPTTSNPSQNAPAPAASRAALDAGTDIKTMLNDSIHSGYNGPGDPVHATVTADVMDEGRVVIPAGSVVTFRVTAIGPATSRGEKGTLGLEAESVMIGGRSYSISGTASDYDFEMRARKVNAGDVVTAAGGAGIGAIIGHVIGGKTGTIIGAVGGAAAGTAVAAKNADRDIIVHANTPLTLVLLNTFQR